MTKTTIATEIDCVDITEMSRNEIFDMCGVTAYYVVKVDDIIVCVTENDSVACDYIADYPGRVSVEPIEQGKFYGED